jgi:RimJ/RimL family protein N-acetyltransferase
VLEKAGLRRTGVLHRHRWAKDRWWDALHYEARREEHRATSA